MSNTILELRGTIDKYEGDAIISFFGAPVEFEDHARRACESAIRMKKAELELNKKFLQDKLAPNPLLTRIGINTGEMVVGNMGTAQKMDYTIMGNAVNLAARLEGVNKQYGTWTLISDATYAHVRNDFVTRELDRVRVVGITEPVRLYELLDTKADVDARTAEGVEKFRVALELFEKKNWEAALSEFEGVLDVLPDDGPATTFIKRCRDYIRKPPAAGWDGVFNLSMK
jgi:adenylate cyclase